METATEKRIRNTALALLSYCRANDWAGHDPYDALNSGLLQKLPFLNFRIPRIALTQALKHSPINLRPLLLIPRTQNPKALALFLKGQLKLASLGVLEDRTLPGKMVERLIALRSVGSPHWCWGYSFPWQTRTLIVPRGAPSLVCTTFVGEALLDAYERADREDCLEMAASAAEYIGRELFWEERDGTCGFAYPTPNSRGRIHNANFLAAAFLARVAHLAGTKNLPAAALKVARYSVAQQREDGSWPYGELPTQTWIDNFHTGYNLCALRALGKWAGTREFEPAVRRGYEFYLEHFFRPDGAARYFHSRDFPIDGHCVAQSLITLTELGDLDTSSEGVAEKVFTWAMAHMWDKRAFFFYRVHGIGKTRTSYMRWVQAWMFLALTTLMEGAVAGTALSKPMQEESVSKSLTA